MLSMRRYGSKRPNTRYKPKRMTTQAHVVCAGCGARLAPEASQCDLCGLPVGVAPDEPTPPRASGSEAPSATPAPPAPASVGAPPRPAAQGSYIVCGTCGHQNTLSARFCNQCGAAFIEAPVASDEPPALGVVPVTEVVPVEGGIDEPYRPPEPEPPASKRVPGSPAVNKQVFRLVGVSLLVVVGLYLVTLWSKDRPAPPASDTLANTQSGASDETIAPPVAPLDPGVAAQVEAAEAALAAAPDEAARAAARQDLVSLYVSNNRIDKAADVQMQVAEENPTPENWALAGNMYYDWMEQQQGASRTFAAKQAIAAYQKALALEPDNLDVRTDMAVAYLNDPDNPMEAVQQTNKVLEQDPNHLQANFNKGVMLGQIGRLDQAITQFDRVMTLAEPGSQPFERAKQYKAELENLVRQRSNG